MGAKYEFVDEWFVPAPAEEVYDVIGDQLAYPSWWGQVFLEIRGDEGPPHAARRRHAGGARRQPEVMKPLVRYLTPLFRPLFRANHTWTMDRGQEAIVRLLERRQPPADVS